MSGSGKIATESSPHTREIGAGGWWTNAESQVLNFGSRQPQSHHGGLKFQFRDGLELLRRGPGLSSYEVDCYSVGIFGL